MDARLIPTVYDAARKVVQLQKLKDEFKRCNEVLNNDYDPYDEDPKVLWRKKKLVRYIERIAEQITHTEKELYGNPELPRATLSESKGSPTTHKEDSKQL